MQQLAFKYYKAKVDVFQMVPQEVVFLYVISNDDEFVPPVCQWYGHVVMHQN